MNISPHHLSERTLLTLARTSHILRLWRSTLVEEMERMDPALRDSCEVLSKTERDMFHYRTVRHNVTELIRRCDSVTDCLFRICAKHVAGKDINIEQLKFAVAGGEIPHSLIPLL